MSSVTRYVTEWLNRPQRTRRDDLVVAAVSAALLAAIGYLGGLLLDAIGLISFGNTIPVWAAAVIGGATLTLGLVLGRRSYIAAPQAHELYTQHLRDALADLRMLTAGELPNFSLGDYIETGIFEPAHRLLTTHGRDRGDVRFSILHPDPNNPAEFRMASEDDLLPALGHSMEGRQQFRLAIDQSFSGFAYRTGRTQVSNDLKRDERWTPHPRAREGREYESMVSVPLMSEGSPDGVLNVLATRAHAFERVDQTYITLLGSVIDLARSISQQWV